MTGKRVSINLVIGVFLLLGLSVFAAYHPKAGLADPGIDVFVRTIIENSTVFPDDFGAFSMAVGDLTNDGTPDLVVTKSFSARAAVFQNNSGVWDNGTLLQGPSITNAHHPIVAPIRNDGKNWLVYSEHRTGNSGEWLRAHRYSGTTLVENQDITGRFAWPGWMSPGVADLDSDGNLEIWLISLHGDPTLHLRRHVWDPGTSTYPGVEIKDGGQSCELLRNPLAGDFLGNGTQSLIWAPQCRQLDLVTYTPGSGTVDHASTLVFSATADISDFHAGAFDSSPEIDIALATWDGVSSDVYLISGGTFTVTQIATGLSEWIKVVRMGDLDGDGLAEIYAAGSDGGIYGYDTTSGWRLLGTHPGVAWQGGVTARWTGAERDEVLFGAPIGGRAFRVVSLSTHSIPDTIPPADITDLAATTGVGSGEVELVWTAPGDDGPLGRASLYDLRYGTEPVTAESWSSATPLSGLPTPGRPGDSQTYLAVLPFQKTHYYFAIRSADEALNWSGLSNSADATSGYLPPVNGLVEEFNSSAGFIFTSPNITISNGRVNWSVSRNPAQYRQYVYRSIPRMPGDLRLIVRGQIDSWTNNCLVRAGIGEAPGVGVSVNFGFYGGGCATQGPVITGSGVELGYVEKPACTFNDQWLWIAAARPYTATLTLAGGQADLSVPEVGTTSGTRLYNGQFTKLFVGLTGDGDWPSCSGSVDSIIIESLGDIEPVNSLYSLYLPQVHR